MLDGGHEVNEVFFDNVEVPAENLIGERNKGWTYAKHLLSHERTNIADVNRAKRELERASNASPRRRRVGPKGATSLFATDRQAGSGRGGAGDAGAARAVGRNQARTRWTLPAC